MPETNSTTQPLTSVERRARAEHLRQLVTDAVAVGTADGILLSGGLDTSIVATVAAGHRRRLRAFSVSVADAPGPDEPFARQLAARLGFELHILRPRLRDLIEHMPEVMRVLNSFDPMNLRNSVVTYVGLESARTAGIRSVLTGDAADELFAGYSYMFNMPPDQLPIYIRHLNEVMQFTSIPMGRALEIGVELPYLASPVRTFALTLEVADLVGERDGRRFGKKILREAFADVLPEEVAWRVKTPIEFGSGSTDLRRVAVAEIADAEFERARPRVAEDDGVRLRDKEQYFYYRVYRRILPPPREQARSAKTCPECQGPVPRLDSTYCRLCGAYPV